MPDEYAVQMGLFGKATVVDWTHVVHAHTRVLADGTSTFVAEHVRWNRGRANAAPQPRRDPPAPATGQLKLWSR